MDSRLLLLLGVGALALLVPLALRETDDGKTAAANHGDAGEGGINWIWNDLERGIEIARKENKPVLISFWAEWCGWCVKMDREVMTDAEVVRYISANFVPVKINSDLPENRNLLLVYQITGHPSFVILDSEGRFLGKTVGYMPKEVFLQYLDGYAG
ncbi:MAG: thioredoxin family protein [Euryarchaeota archaeon]|nr:thioredoxin family protein [Euryarchaeota archaeon]